MASINLEDIQAAPQSTPDDQLVINMPSGKLPVGQHRFRLTVEDDSGNKSVPANVVVIVVDTQAPTAILNLHDAEGILVSDGRIPFGNSFILSAKGSTDTGGGSVVRFQWELLPPGPIGPVVVGPGPVSPVIDPGGLLRNNG